MDEIEQLHQDAYEAERAARWGMAEAGEAPAAVCLRDHIQQYFEVLNEHDPIRYDNIWFQAFPPEKYEWVKGAPDFVIPIELQDQSSYFMTEIKIKAKEFGKTQWGGITPRGSSVPRYGCTSYYLDVTPVHKNMCDFCETTGLPESKFILAFVSSDNQECNLITLEEVNNILENGWNGIPIATFYEGYGQPAFLIPKDATTPLSSLSHTDFLDLAMSNVILPPEE